MLMGKASNAQEQLKSEELSERSPMNNFKLENTMKIVQLSIGALTSFVMQCLVRGVESIRMVRAAFSLLNALECVSCPFSKKNLLDRLLSIQPHDGGWADPEETAWAISVISRLSREDSEIIQKAQHWLESVRNPNGGWGRHPRDRVRIPTTSLVLTLVPSVGIDSDREWVRLAWEKDLNSPVRLSYKGGFYLLTINNDNKSKIDPLVSRTIAYLAEDQNDDGGFGPWRNHPIGSDPWSTGVVLWGLSKWIDNVDPVVIEKALAWLERTQLPSGYWPYHYLDEGTSYALIGTVAALRAMASRK